MKDLIEIRWHGRGGQGAKTASLLLADAAFNTGKYIQGFPEFDNDNPKETIGHIKSFLSGLNQN